MIAGESLRWGAHFWVGVVGGQGQATWGSWSWRTESQSLLHTGRWGFLLRSMVPDLTAIEPPNKKTKFEVNTDIRAWWQLDNIFLVWLYSPTKITSLCLAPLCLRYGVTSSYVGTSAMSYISLFLHSYMDLLVFLSLLLRRKLLLKPAGGQDDRERERTGKTDIKLKYTK